MVLYVLVPRVSDFLTNRNRNSRSIQEGYSSQILIAIKSSTWLILDDGLQLIISGSRITGTLL